MAGEDFNEADFKDPVLTGLEELQEKIGEWSRGNFGDNFSLLNGQPQYSGCAFWGLVEEVGELAGATIKFHQGRRGFDPRTREGCEKFKRYQRDAVGDILIFLLDYCGREGINALEALNETWSEIVSKRTVKNWEQHTHENSSDKPQNVKKENNEEAKDESPMHALIRELAELMGNAPKVPKMKMIEGGEDRKLTKFFDLPISRESCETIVEIAILKHQSHKVVSQKEIGFDLSLASWMNPRGAYIVPVSESVEETQAFLKANRWCEYSSLNEPGMLPIRGYIYQGFLKDLEKLKFLKLIQAESIDDMNKQAEEFLAPYKNGTWDIEGCPVVLAYTKKRKPEEVVSQTGQGWAEPNEDYEKNCPDYKAQDPVQNAEAVANKAVETLKKAAVEAMKTISGMTIGRDTSTSENIIKKFIKAMEG